MSTTAREQIKQIQSAQMGVVNDFDGSDGNFPITIVKVKQLHRRVITAGITDAGGAGDNATERSIFGADNGPVRVVTAYISLPVTATAHAANYVTFTLAKRTAGGAATTIATRVTDVAGGTLTAFAESAMTLTASAVELALNDELTLKAVKAGAGVAISGALSNATIYVTVEEI